ncbi:hemagglutinin repeat-containing protein, partial [Sebaldella sp. S0638]|uniref:hemagglutinin repeat-containing protein n=1 Tax=Sebaldella sp. S0638 TaxID=2957809 RepID=UPI00209E55C8
KNVNIENEKETTYLEAKAKYGGTFEKTEAESRRSNEYAAASTIIGNNIIIDAENDINVRASNLIAVKDGLENTGGNISLAAGNNVNILVDTLENSSYSKIKTSGFSTNFSSGGGGLSTGVSYNKSSTEQQRNGTNVSVSTIISEGNTVIDAGNRVRTEAMQANIGENLVIRGVNGVELLDAKEVFEEKVKQKSTSVGLSVSVGSTVTSFVDQASNMYNNRDKYGTTNASELINTAGDGLTLFRSGVSAFNDAQSIYDKLATGIHPANALAGITANVSLSFNQSSYESNTSGTTSVAGNINVGKNFILQSENGDVTLINQKINVGENFVVDARNFEARAGENTYSNDTKSSSVGGNIGYDFAQHTVTGGANISGGNSNTNSKTYDNTIINVGGTFQLTTKEDATFAGVNVKADKINFDIGRNLSIISLQDESKSEGKNYGIGGGYSQNNKTTNKPEVGAFTGNLSYGQNNGESKWVNNQTSIIADNGGNIKVGETLTNIGAIIGSLSEEKKLSIEANKVVVSDLEDYNRGENIGANMGGIGFNNKAPIGQTGIQYGSHDKEQDTKATFVNTEVTEAGKKLNLEELGINTDITKAQVVTKDEVVEQIDTNIHTDLLNTKTRQQFMEDTRKAGHGILDIIDSAGSDDLKYETARFDRYSQYYIEKNPQFQEFKDKPDSKNAEEIKQITKDYIKYMTGKDVDVVLIATGDGSGYIRGDQTGEKKKDVFLLDITDLASDVDIASLYGHEGSHVDDHRRGRDAGNEENAGSSGDRLSEILGDKEKSNGFDLSKWLSDDKNLESLVTGRERIATEYDGYEIEGFDYKKMDHTKCVPVGNPACYKQVIPEKQFKEIMEKTEDKVFAPLKGLGDTVNITIPDENTKKKTPINHGSKPKNTPTPKSVIEYASEKVKIPDCNEECQNNFVNSMNNYYNPDKSDGTDYLTKGYSNLVENNNKMAWEEYNNSLSAGTEHAKLVNEYRNKYPILTDDFIVAQAYEISKNPDKKSQIEGTMEFYQNTSFINFKVLNDASQWSPWMALAGSGLIQVPDQRAKLAGIALMTPEILRGGYSTYEKVKSGDYEGAVEDGTRTLTLSLLAGMAYQDSKSLSLQSAAGKDNNNGKFFDKGDGVYYPENGTSEGYVSGNNFMRVNYVNGSPANAYGRIDGNTIMIDRTSSGMLQGTNLMSPGITNVLGLSGTSQTNVGSLPYTQPQVRPSEIYVYNPVTGEIVINQNGLTGLKPTVLPSYNAQIIVDKLSNLPSNAQNAFANYENIGWQGNFSGQTNGTKARGEFQNKNALLPEYDSNNIKIEYKEFDINNKIPGQQRDKERFVIGSDGSVYFTDDHYKTFKKIK